MLLNLLQCTGRPPLLPHDNKTVQPMTSTVPRMRNPVLQCTGRPPLPPHDNKTAQPMTSTVPRMRNPVLDRVNRCNFYNCPIRQSLTTRGDWASETCKSKLRRKVSEKYALELKDLVWKENGSSVFPPFSSWKYKKHKGEEKQVFEKFVFSKTRRKLNPRPQSIKMTASATGDWSGYVEEKTEANKTTGPMQQLEICQGTSKNTLLKHKGHNPRHRTWMICLHEEK